MPVCCRVHSASLSARSSQHVLDVGGKRRIGVDEVFELTGRDAKAHRQTENVAKLVAGMADEMRAENAVAQAIDNDLRPGDGFSIGTRRKPFEHIVSVNLD